MSPAAATAVGKRPGPGRPSTGARERILAGAYEVLKRDGYAGMTTAKVAAASGQNKGLIAYHFGSKQGLVAAVARQVSDTLVAEVLEQVGEPSSAADLVEGLTSGVWRVMERDAGIQRVYFDLASQSVVEPRVGEIIREMKAGYRGILRELLRGLDHTPPARDLDAIVVYLIAGLEGLSLERLERGETAQLRGARDLFVSSASAVVAGG
jgi:AcrR family transcriptional regulator